MEAQSPASAPHRTAAEDRSARLKLAPELERFLREEALPGTGLSLQGFLGGLETIFAELSPRNHALLKERDTLQQKIDGWHRAHPEARSGAPRVFLEEIGYLAPEPAPFHIRTSNVDDEIAQLAGPQLVVPVLNARFVLNAANARWGSLYDALYGTDAMDGKTPPAPGGYDPRRGAQVILWSKHFLDAVVPLKGMTWADWRGGELPLAEPGQLVGRAKNNLLLRHHGLHIEIVIDPSHAVGQSDPAGIADVLLEAALTTIVDLEDSVAAVDGADKVEAYRNWLGLMRGDLAASFTKDGRTMTRRMAKDRSYVAPDGSALTLAGRSLLLVRNVGHLMTTPAAHFDGAEAFEGILDAAITSLIALHDLKGLGQVKNSRKGSIYIVKPKMHGPDEARFTNDLFAAVEDLLGLARNTIKVGVMDEERRTSANLAASIAAVKERIFFINTGFLDRTGDEIHTSMLAGAFLRKADIKAARWIKAYEDRNVQIGLACGLAGKAQIGKGMWAAPDRMHAMLAEKIGHPMSGANTAWVPSPTAATLHATHYHRCDVAERQRSRAEEKVSPLEDLLTVPLAHGVNWTQEEVREELDNNVQGILGYVVRWVDQGVGCSKVPDIHDIGLMEDRATLRISSQHIANWLLHGVVTADEVEQSLRRMAKKVDSQNAGDNLYRPMSGRESESQAFQAAHQLIFDGVRQPNGYTEPTLHAFRQKEKQRTR
ncbi:MAG: malate synthase G [Rhizomicrobium sp.]